MKTTFIVLGIAVSLLLLSGLLVGGACISYKGQAVQLESAFAAQQKVCETFHDQMWKVISQTAQVPEAAKAAFSEMYQPLIEGRYGNEKGGALMKFIQENNPQFDWSLYKNVQVAIEAKRAEFTREQTRLLDLKREHDVLRRSPISSLFVGSAPELQAKIVTSSRTDAAFATGKDDDIKVFEGGK